jgi:hypothetical protein
MQRDKYSKSYLFAPQPFVNSLLQHKYLFVHSSGRNTVTSGWQVTDHARLYATFQSLQSIANAGRVPLARRMLRINCGESQ